MRALCSSGSASAALVILLFLPSGLASMGQGEFVVASVTQPVGSATRVAPLSLFSNGTSDLDEWTLTAPVVDVTRLRETLFDVRDETAGSYTVTVHHEVASYRLTNVNVSLTEGDHAGWFGIYTVADSRLEITSSSTADARPCSPCLTGNTLDPEMSPDPEVTFYSQSSTETVVAQSVAGDFLYRGPGVAKIQGPDLVLRASENTTYVATGLGPTTGIVTTERTLTQLFFRFEGELAWRTRSQVRLTANEIETTFDGTLALGSASGEVRTTDEQYAAKSEPAVLSGKLETRVRPLSPSSLQVALSGDLRSASIHGERIPAPLLGAADGLLTKLMLGALVAAVVVGAGTAFVVVKRRSTRVETMEIDELRDLATLAAERQDFGLALSWIRRAKTRVPDHPRLLDQEAFYLNELGELDEALAVLAKSSSLSTTGEPDLLAARFLVDHGASDPEIRPWVERALDRSPELFLELDDDEFVPLARQPWFRQAIDGAKARFEAADEAQ